MKNTPFKLRSGNKAAYSDLQMQKESPVKIAPIFAAIGKFLATAGPKIATAAKTVGSKALTFAKNNPELFMEQISNPKLERKQIIMDAEDERIIIINASNRKINWGFGNKELITVIPVGINPYDHFVDYSFDSDGKEVYKKICKLLAGETEIEKKSIKSTKSTLPSTPSQHDTGDENVKKKNVTSKVK